MREGVDEQRGREQEGEPVARRQRAHQRAEARPDVAHEPPAEAEPDRQRRRRGQEDLGREGRLQPEQRGDPPDEAASAERPVDEAHDRERDERQQEHRRHMHVPELLSEHVAGEPEDVAADDRRPQRDRQVPAEQVGAPRGEGGSATAVTL